MTNKIERCVHCGKTREQIEQEDDAYFEGVEQGKKETVAEVEKMMKELMHVYPNEEAGFYLDVDEFKQKLQEMEK